MPTKTAQQRRADAKVAYDAYLAQCPSRQLLARISDKWVTLIICALGDSETSMRYSELARQIPGVSQKMLTQTLRSLERDGLVARTVTAAVPPRVDYALTPLGRSFLEPIQHIKCWAENHMPEVDRARAAYDATLTQ
ncbi:winged helix-turn-helix transcriptional regulator [Enemella evansiae]|uniref:winged helix-turn-helix transcriptional regulator n=1 Tax=Enemella evansiae TaxID=2016499 RepID=UPI000B979497|nr:helix-turn-helix domain-containing protein [Enemella evansiae]OYO13148.1 transcriptional regulator [Enemella evansiae]TDO86087.1 HxlR family transcriptional regulator [Enemella evansiae]